MNDNDCLMVKYVKWFIVESAIIDEHPQVDYIVLQWPQLECGWTSIHCEYHPCTVLA